MLALAIFVGSSGLRNFDAALIGYATATVILTFGVTYRYAMWVQTPPTRRYLIRPLESVLLVPQLAALPHDGAELDGVLPRVPDVSATPGASGARSRTSWWSGAW
jgi:hypothetical protein